MVNHPKTQLTAAWAQPAELIVTSSTDFGTWAYYLLCNAEYSDIVNSVLMKYGSPKAKPKVNHPKTQVAHCSTQPAELIVTSSTDFGTWAYYLLCNAESPHRPASCPAAGGKKSFPPHHSDTVGPIATLVAIRYNRSAHSDTVGAIVANVRSDQK